MQDKKLYFIVSIIVLGLFAFLFWVGFAIVSYRRPVYQFETEGRACYKEEYKLYYEKDDVKYYSACFDSISVVEERFIFHKRYSLKKYIDDDSLHKILQKAIIYKWKYDFGVQTDYYVDNYNYSEDGDFVITKCNEDSDVSYYIHREKDQNLCSWMHRYHAQIKKD